jgi:general secretion pathway protein H
MPRKNKGFTLLELMVVVAVIAVGAAGVALSLRDASATALEREADRLAAVLDAARAQSRASGVALYFRPTPEGFLIEGMQGAKVQAWLSQGVQVQSASAVELGPEPIIAPSRIVLSLGEQTRAVSTDGLLPFRTREVPSGS